MNMTVRIQLSIMMFLQFFIWGAWFVTMFPYLSEGLKFQGTDIGYAYSTTGFAAIISPLFVGMIADRFFSAERVMSVLHLIGAVLMYYVSTLTSPGPFFWVLLLYTLCYMPTLALVNSIAFSHMVSPEKEFPAIRVIGTIGWIVAGLTVGTVVRSFLGYNIEPTPIPMRIAAGASLLMGLYCLTLPHTPPKGRGQKVRVGDLLGLDALKLMKEPSFAIFIISSLLICIPLSFYYQSANGFLNAFQIPDAASKMTMGQMSEIIFMLLMPLFFLRLGVKSMLIIGMLAWVLRYVLFAYFPSLDASLGGTLGDPSSAVFLLYLGIILHGICYDFFFVTGQIYVDKKAPGDFRASAQGFLTLVTLGIGMVIGNLINGRVTQHYTVTSGDVVTTNWQMIWIIPAVMAGVVAVVFAILFRDRVSARDESKDEPVVMV